MDQLPLTEIIDIAPGIPVEMTIELELLGDYLGRFN